tara:strand:+ start:486 stop:743 length:258 start_codon:yes stop_codon:yes gene_type:complete
MIFFFTILLSILICDSYCPTDNMFSNRSLYNIGDMLSEEDQNILFPVCNGSGNYETDDNFSFSDLDGNQNGGDYKITLISMNATW